MLTAEGAERRHRIVTMTHTVAKVVMKVNCLYLIKTYLILILVVINFTTL